VKIKGTLLGQRAQEAAADKENAGPWPPAAAVLRKFRRQEDRAQDGELYDLQEEQERQRRLKAEEDEKRRLLEEEELRARREEEERQLREEADRRREATRLANLQAEMHAEEEAAFAAAMVADAAEQREIQNAERLRKERERVDRQKTDAFLCERGFADVNAKRKGVFFNFKYPLHSAVKRNDVELVRALLACGADGSLQNSAGLTATQLAEKLSKKGSHATMYKVLSKAMTQPTPRRA